MIKIIKHKYIQHEKVILFNIVIVALRFMRQ